MRITSVSDGRPMTTQAHHGAGKTWTYCQWCTWQKPSDSSTHPLPGRHLARIPWPGLACCPTSGARAHPCRQSAASGSVSCSWVSRRILAEGAICGLGRCRTASRLALASPGRPHRGHSSRGPIVMHKPEILPDASAAPHGRYGTSALTDHLGVIDCAREPEDMENPAHKEPGGICHTL